jgi:lysophospholipase L1-like esterase
MMSHWTRFVALGDSLTEGVGDPVDGRLRGWADRLAAGLRTSTPELRFWNLGRRSLTTKEVRDAQLERALGLKPDLVGAAVGMNDILAPDFDGASYASDLAALVEPLAATGATLLMGTFPGDMPLLRVMPRSKATAFRQRLADASDAVRAVATSVGAVCVDGPDGWSYGMADCSLDGCHPNARGHALIAELFLDALSERAGTSLGSIDRSDCGLVATSLGHLRWIVLDSRT